jgi:hypothetical protein
MSPSGDTCPRQPILSLIMSSFLFPLLSSPLSNCVSEGFGDREASRSVAEAGPGLAEAASPVPAASVAQASCQLVPGFFGYRLVGDRVASRRDVGPRLAEAASSRHRPIGDIGRRRAAGVTGSYSFLIRFFRITNALLIRHLTRLSLNKSPSSRPNAPRDWRPQMGIQKNYKHETSEFLKNSEVCQK